MKKSGSLLCHRAGGTKPDPRAPEDGTQQELLLSAQVPGLSRSPGTPDSIRKEAPPQSLLFPFMARALVPGPHPTGPAGLPGSSLLLQPALPSLPEACSTGSQPALYFSLRSGAHLCKTGARERGGLQYK